MSDDQTPVPDNLRDATPEEAHMIQSLARVIGRALVAAWQQLPPELQATHSMSETFSASLIHNLGQLLAAAAKEDIPPDHWQAWMDVNVAMLRTTADEALRLRRDHSAEPVAPRLMVAQPPSVM